MEQTKIYSCAYPIWHTFYGNINDEVVYTILIGNTVIYEGFIYLNEKEQSIDISHTCRGLMGTNYENVTLGDITIESLKPQLTPDGKLIINSINTFTVRSSRNLNGEDIEYTVAYDYNTEYISELPDSDNINDPILLEVDPRQRISTCGYNIRYPHIFTFHFNDREPTERQIHSDQFQILSVNLAQYELIPGDTITLSNSGVSHTYKITSPCSNRFVLYYVNKYGGLDSLLCSGKSIESLNPSRTDIRLYNNRLNRRDFENHRIHSDIEKAFKLNTGYIDDEGAAKIDHLINSPKVWIHDLEKDTITSCIIDDTNYTIKNFRNDSMFSYEINVTESQRYLRK